MTENDFCAGRRVCLSQSEEPESPYFKDQVPHSFSQSFRSIEVERFQKWIKFKKFSKKRLFRKSGKFADVFLVYRIENQFCFYVNDSDDEWKRYDLGGGDFIVGDKKRRKLVLSVNEITTQEECEGEEKVHTVKKKDLKIVVKCLNPLDFEELILLLRSSGVKESLKKELDYEEIEEDEVNPFHCIQEVRKWRNEDVLEWAKDILLGKYFDRTFFEVSGDYIKREKIDGNVILGWSTHRVNQFLRTFKITSGDQRRISKLLRGMISSGNYDRGPFLLTKKVVQMLRTKPSEFNYVNILRLRKVFGNEKMIQRQILRIMYDFEGIPSDESILKGVLSKRSKFFSVKVNIVENLKEENQKRRRRVLGKLLAVTDLMDSMKDLGESMNQNESSSRFGIFHSSISIGNLQLEWIDSSLIIVRSVCSEKAIMSCDVGKLEVKNGMDFSSGLAKEIIKWNISYKYRSTKSSFCSGNCQNFVQRIIYFLGLKYRFSPRVKKFLARMKYKGVCEKVFRFDKRFCDYFFPSGMGKKKKEMDEGVFEESEDDLNEFEKFRKNREFRPRSHKELDLFVQMLFKKNPYFERDFNEDFQLLKSFDRAYWLQYYDGKKKKNETVLEVCEPAKRTSNIHWRVSGCPFTPPRKKKRSGRFGMKLENDF